MRLSQLEPFSKEEVTVWTKKHIQLDSVELPEFKWVNTMIGNIKNAISGTSHSVSKKQVPRYLAEYCYCFNRRLNLSPFGRVLFLAVFHCFLVTSRTGM
jgi:hypothetical protein